MKSITATAVTAQIIAQVASQNIYGGTTINRIDEILAPFVTESFNKHQQVAEQWQIPTRKVTLWRAPKKSVTTPSSRWKHQVNTLHTANGQTPFVTFGFGRCWVSTRV
ncbi:anaerobic ribonucleoside-triphosphate reductase [Serratia proteamaculans]